MTLQQLTYFLAAAEHGSFSAGAESLFMAQPSLSEQIRRLEGELGVPLFARVGRGLALTEAGRLFRPPAERTPAAAPGGSEAGRGGRGACSGRTRSARWRLRRRQASRSAGCATSRAALSSSGRSAAPTTTCS